MKIIRKIHNRIIFRKTLQYISETIAELNSIPYREAKHILYHSYLMEFIDTADENMRMFIWHYDCEYWAREIIDSYNIKNKKG